MHDHDDLYEAPEVFELGDASEVTLGNCDCDCDCNDGKQKKEGQLA